MVLLTPPLDPVEISPGRWNEYSETGMSHLVARRKAEYCGSVSWEVCEGLTGVCGRTGIVGTYSAEDLEAGVALLREAQRLCVEQGAVRVIGPMDGSTWQSYRLAIDDSGFPPRNRRQPFFREPWNLPEDVYHFEVAGFRPVAYYQSRVVTHPGAPRPGASALASRIARMGITVSPLGNQLHRRILEEVWPICRDAFTSAPYYRAIDFPRFSELHLRLLDYIASDFILLARSSSGRLLAFVFAYGESGPGRIWTPDNHVILKTLAVSPDCRAWGIGTHLADEIHRLARERHFAGVIHALMNEGNASMRISLKFGSVPYARYALYEWTP